MSKKGAIGRDFIQAKNSFNYPRDNYLIQGSGSYYQLSEKEFIKARKQDDGAPTEINDPNSDYTWAKNKPETTYDKMAKAHFKEEDRRKYEEERNKNINRKPIPEKFIDYTVPEDPTQTRQPAIDYNIMDQAVPAGLQPPLQPSRINIMDQAVPAGLQPPLQPSRINIMDQAVPAGLQPPLQPNAFFFEPVNSTLLPRPQVRQVRNANVRLNQTPQIQRVERQQREIGNPFRNVNIVVPEIPRIIPRDPPYFRPGRINTTMREILGPSRRSQLSPASERITNMLMNNRGKTRAELTQADYKDILNIRQSLSSEEVEALRKAQTQGRPFRIRGG